MIISVENLLPRTSPVTFLTGPISVGSGTLPVKALNQFNASWAMQIGETGEAQTEIVLLSASSPNGTIGTITGTTVFAHPTDTPVYGIKYDQIVFERSTTGTAGTAVPMSSGTIGIMPNGTTTIFDDTSGSSTYAYKTYFRNSVLNQTSPESDWQTFAGYPLYSLGKIRSSIKNKLFNASYIPDDGMINDWINEWLEVMTNAAIELNKDYLLGSTSLTYGANVELGTITATDFKQVRRVWVTNGSGTAPVEATYTDINDFDPSTIYDQTLPLFYMYGDTIMGRRPYSSSATFGILYYKLPPILVNDGDQLPVSMQGYSKSFVDYGLAQAKRKDNLPQEADSLEASAQSQLQRFKADMTPRVQTGPIYARLEETIDSADDYWM